MAASLCDGCVSSRPADLFAAARRGPVPYSDTRQWRESTHESTIDATSNPAGEELGFGGKRWREFAGEAAP